MLKSDGIAQQQPWFKDWSLLPIRNWSMPKLCRPQQSSCFFSAPRRIWLPVAEAALAVVPLWAFRLGGENCSPAGVWSARGGVWRLLAHRWCAAAGSALVAQG